MHFYSKYSKIHENCTLFFKNDTVVPRISEDIPYQQHAWVGAVQYFNNNNTNIYWEFPGSVPTNK